MKFVIVLVLWVAGSNAEAPIRRVPQRFFGFERVQEAPYAPAGYRPEIEFNLPQKQRAFPQTLYAPPPVEYGPPETTTEADITTTTEPQDIEVSTTESTFGKLKDEVNKEAEEIPEDQEQGVYYIYHPDGLLQRIVYVTKNDLKNMAYSAQFKYQDVEPIIDPIYTYDPETLVLRQVRV